MDDVVLRRATAADAGSVADVYLASRRAFVDFAPLAHPDVDVVRWVADVLIPTGGVMVAASRRRGGAVLGLMACSRREGTGWIDQLYLHPRAVGCGIGTRFVAHAKADLGAPIRLYTFQANRGSRRFYERHGFRAIAFGDGSGNEEGCPDVQYEWTGDHRRRGPASAETSTGLDPAPDH